ncbi:hypothetical protein Mapa_013332 [Marchantia paleacea]|nr:hypothetical protein Mapa_013332 [Marchantia paleacea]
MLCTLRPWRESSNHASVSMQNHENHVDFAGPKSGEGTQNSGLWQGLCRKYHQPDKNPVRGSGRSSSGTMQRIEREDRLWRRELILYLHSRL